MGRPLIPLTEAAGSARMALPRAWLLLAAALGCVTVGLLAGEDGARLLAFAAGLTMVFIVLGLRGLTLVDDLRQLRLERGLARLVEGDITPCFTTDDVGAIRHRNTAAVERFQGQDVGTLVAALQDHFASPGAVLYRLQRRAETLGRAREDVVTRRGHTRLAVHAIAPQRYLWRLEEFQDRAPAGRGADTLSLPMLVANKQGVVLYANEALRRLVGARPKRLDRLFTTSELHPGEEVTVSGVDGPVRAILAEVAGAGERREIYLMPVADRPQASVAEFEQVPVPLLTFEVDGSLRAANAAAREMLGFASDARPMFHELYEGLGRPVSDWLADVAEERIPAPVEVLRHRTSAIEAFHQLTLRRIVDQGRPGVLVIPSDATALKTLEAQFVQSQKMQAIGQLAGGIAHDFNNLLTAISGHCDLLLLRHDRLDPEYADLVQIHQNANRAASLVGQLLAFSRKQTLKPERIDLVEAMSDLTHLLNRLVGERVTLQLQHDIDIGPIRADRRQFEQVIMNLVVNARDAMTEGGTIRITTAAETLREDLARDRAVVPAGDWSVIRVSDTGVGIPPDRLTKIFEPFFTTKRTGEGTGLGLSTAYGIVKQSGGFIFVDSTPGEGTVFTLYFPVRHDTEGLAAPRPAAPARVVMRPGEGVVLLVEDEAPVRAFASRALRMRGFTVLEADSAEEALRTLEDPALEVDVFVTDVVMPGMDGPSWVREALERRPNVRVIFVSGYAEDCLSEAQARIPNSVFLPKPFSLNDLAATVQGLAG